MRYIRVLEPAAVFRDMVDGEVWGEDAVHPTAAAYREIAISTVRLSEGALCLPIGGGKRQRPAEAAEEPREDSQRGGGWQPLGGGCYLRYEDRDGGGGSRDGSNIRRNVQDVEVIGEYGGGGGGQGGGSDGYRGGGGGQRGGQRGRPWNGGRGYGGGGRRPRRS
jgi:hypothetical protein